MVKNPALLKQFENSLLKGTGVDYPQNLRIFEALFEEARALGIFPLKEPLDGIEVDVHLAKVINVRTAPRQDRRRT
jgi:hypothetical protein